MIYNTPLSPPSIKHAWQLHQCLAGSSAELAFRHATNSEQNAQHDYIMLCKNMRTAADASAVPCANSSIDLLRRRLPAKLANINYKCV